MVFKLPKIFSSYTELLERQQSSIMSAAAFITVATIISSITGIARFRLLETIFYSRPLGREELDAFYFAFQIPDMMFKLIILGALSAAFIPVFIQYQKKSEEEAFYMTSVLMNLLLTIFIIIGTIVFIFAPQISTALAGSAYTARQIEVTTTLTRIMVFTQFFFAISNFFTGVLQSYKRFVAPALAPIVYNVGIVLGAYFFSPMFGIYAAGIGVVLGAFLHMLIQLPTILKLRFRYSFSLNFHHEGMRKVVKLTPARSTTLGISETQDLIIGKFVTSISSISYTIFTYATQLMTLPIRLFGVSIAQAALPFLSAESDEKDLHHFRDLVLQLIHQISFFAFPASVLLLILRIPIVRILFGAKDLPWTMTLTTARMLGIISISITAQAIVQLLIRAFYALKNTKTPLKISLITSGLYITISWASVFVLQLGMDGIAIAITTSAIVEMLLFLYLLDRRVAGFARSAFWIPQIKMIIASFFMAVFLYLPFRILDELVFKTTKTTELILLTLTTATIGMLVYIYFAMLFDIRELYILQNMINKIGSWKKTLSKTEEVLLESNTQGSEV